MYNAIWTKHGMYMARLELAGSPAELSQFAKLVRVYSLTDSSKDHESKLRYSEYIHGNSLAFWDGFDGLFL